MLCSKFQNFIDWFHYSYIVLQKNSFNYLIINQKIGIKIHCYSYTIKFFDNIPQTIILPLLIVFKGSVKLKHFKKVTILLLIWSNTLNSRNDISRSMTFPGLSKNRISTTSTWMWRKNFRRISVFKRITRNLTIWRDLNWIICARKVHAVVGYQRMIITASSKTLVFRLQLPYIILNNLCIIFR